MKAEIEFHVESCLICGVIFAITKDHLAVLKQCGRRFKCPNGHEQYYPTEEQREEHRREKEKKARENGSELTLEQRQELIRALHDAEQAEAKAADAEQRAAAKAPRKSETPAVQSPAPPAPPAETPADFPVYKCDGTDDHFCAICEGKYRTRSVNWIVGHVFKEHAIEVSPQDVNARSPIRPFPFQVVRVGKKFRCTCSKLAFAYPQTVRGHLKTHHDRSDEQIEELMRDALQAEHQHAQGA